MIATSLRPQLTLLAPATVKDAWCAPAYRLLVEAPGLDEPFEALLQQPFLTVGRDRDAGLLLPDTRVSRRHAYLHLTDDGVYVIYLNRRAGVADDGFSPRGGWLSEPAGVDVGPYHIVLTREPHNRHSDALPAKRCDLTSTAPDRSNRLKLHIHAPQAPRAVRSLRRHLTLISRGKPAHLQLVHPSVSRPHCLLVEHGERLWVVDLHSRLGTRVNGQTVQVASVDASDRLRLGEVAVQVHDSRKAARNGDSADPLAGDAGLLEPTEPEHCERCAPAPDSAASPDLAIPPDDVRPAEADAARDRAEHMARRLDAQQEAQQALREGFEQLAARLEGLEADRKITEEQTERQLARTQGLAERIEQLNALCAETRDGSHGLHDGMRELAGSLERVQRTLDDQQCAWRQELDSLRDRLIEQEQRVGEWAAKAGAAEQDELSQQAQRHAALQEAWEQQRRAFEGQIRALDPLRDHWEQAAAQLRGECERLREAWREQTAARADDKSELLERCEAAIQQQQKKTTVELADQLRRRYGEHLEQCEQQHRARAGEHVRMQQQVHELNELRQGLHEEYARIGELLDREREARARQTQQRDEQNGRLEKLVNEQADSLKQLGRRIADLERARRPENGNGHDAEASIVAGKEELRAEFHDVIRRATGEMQQQLRQLREQLTLERVEADDETRTGEAQPVPSCERPDDIPLRDETAAPIAHDATAPAQPEAPTTADRAPSDDRPRDIATDDVATQWLFQRTVTIREDRRRMSRRRAMLVLGVTSIAVVTAGGFALWWFDLIGAAGRLLFG